MSSRNRSNVYYVLGLGVLIAGAVGMQIAKSNGSLYIIKKPLPIRKALVDFDRDAIKPHQVMGLSPLSPEMVAELGTTEYINWVLKEPGKRRHAEGGVKLAITYYTDVQDQVPHVPEECMYQGGHFTPAGDATLDLKLDSIGKTISVRRLGFFAVGELVKKDYVYYTLCVNGTFCSNRTTARLSMADRRDTHLYYSKVEIHFGDAREADEPKLDEKARVLFDRIIPELMKSHWPPEGSERGGLKPAPKEASAGK